MGRTEDLAAYWRGKWQAVKGLQNRRWRSDHPRGDTSLTVHRNPPDRRRCVLPKALRTATLALFAPEMITTTLTPNA
jgi:hypothetical protein